MICSNKCIKCIIINALIISKSTNYNYTNKYTSVEHLPYPLVCTSYPSPLLHHFFFGEYSVKLNPSTPPSSVRSPLVILCMICSLLANPSGPIRSTRNEAAALPASIASMRSEPVYCPRIPHHTSTRGIGSKKRTKEARNERE